VHRGAFASFLSGGFTTMTVINPPEKKLAKCTSVHWANFNKKVHKPPYWTLKVARVRKARLGAKMHLVSFHIFCKLEYFGL
jgi:hypothetical protein